MRDGYDGIVVYEASFRGSVATRSHRSGSACIMESRLWNFLSSSCLGTRHALYCRRACKPALVGQVWWELTTHMQGRGTHSDILHLGALFVGSSSVVCVLLSSLEGQQNDAPRPGYCVYLWCGKWETALSCWILLRIVAPRPHDQSNADYADGPYSVTYAARGIWSINDPPANVHPCYHLITASGTYPAMSIPDRFTLREMQRLPPTIIEMLWWYLQWTLDRVRSLLTGHLLQKTWMLNRRRAFF